MQATFKRPAAKLSHPGSQKTARAVNSGGVEATPRIKTRAPIDILSA